VAFPLYREAPHLHCLSQDFLFTRAGAESTTAMAPQMRHDATTPGRWFWERSPVITDSLNLPSVFPLSFAASLAARLRRAILVMAPSLSPGLPRATPGPA